MNFRRSKFCHNPRQEYANIQNPTRKNEVRLEARDDCFGDLFRRHFDVTTRKEDANLSTPELKNENFWSSFLGLRGDPGIEKTDTFKMKALYHCSAFGAS